MTAKAKRKREPFEVGDAVPLKGIAIETDEPPEETPAAPRRKRATKAIRPSTTKPKRERPRGRKNYSVDVTTLIERHLQDENFFKMVELVEIPDGGRGPQREFSAITFMLWQHLMDDFDSFHEMEAYFRHELIWGHVTRTLEEAWPDDPTRRVPSDHPMSRSQFHRHRKRLRDESSEVIEPCVQRFREVAHQQARAIGFFAGTSGSLANPDPKEVVSGDGTEIQAATDAIEGDMVVDSDGQMQQARYDATAMLRRPDPEKPANPSFNIAHLQVSQPGIEQERIILDFCRTDTIGGEAKALEQMAAALKDREPNFKHYGYDMAVQGATINRLYRLGLFPAVKVPRNNKNEPASALIETRTVTTKTGRERTVQIFGLDGLAGMKTIANGEELFVQFVPKALREPRPGCMQGFYAFSDHASIPPDLRGREIMIRLDGLTDDGRNRAQYLRWINEHTDAGREILGKREGTESEHSTIKKMLPWKRARCFSEFNLMLDMLGYFRTRNLKAALAYERRMRSSPAGSAPPPQTPDAIAA